MELSMRYYGDPILRRRAGPITEFDDELREFADAMIRTMERERGIGLAAPQVGSLRRMLIALEMESTDDEDAQPAVVVNPTVLARSKDLWVFEEGCLSIPGVVGDVSRPETIEFRYQDLDGKEHTRSATGMFARILLHEIDHLDGKLFIDYLSAAKKSLLKPRLKEITEEHSS